MARRNNGNWSITIDAAGINVVEAAFLNAMGKTLSWIPLWGRIASLRAAETRSIIESRGALIASPETTYGHVWKPADPRYLRRKIRKGKGTIDLMYSGAIRSGLRTLRMTDKSIRYGVTAKHAISMNFVSRPFMGWTSRLRDQCRELMNAWMALIARECEADINRGRNG
jgi:hypothetical protein